MTDSITEKLGIATSVSVSVVALWTAAEKSSVCPMMQIPKAVSPHNIQPLLIFAGFPMK